MPKTNHSIRLLWVLLFIVCLHTSSAYAQDITAISTQDTSVFSPKAVNTVYLEIGGIGGFYSLNYDRRIDRNWSVRVGFSFPQLVYPSRPDVIIPLSASYLISLGNSSSHNLEFGVGATSVVNLFYPSGYNLHYLDYPDNLTIYLSAMVGYRLQPQEGGFNLRILATPLCVLYPFATPKILQFWGGLSIGYTF
jgi:hypothetical protein